MLSKLYNVQSEEMRRAVAVVFAFCYTPTSTVVISDDLNRRIKCRRQTGMALQPFGLVLSAVMHQQHQPAEYGLEGLCGADDVAHVAAGVFIGSACRPVQRVD